MAGRRIVSSGLFVDRVSLAFVALPAQTQGVQGSVSVLAGCCKLRAAVRHVTTHAHVLAVVRSVCVWAVRDHLLTVGSAALRGYLAHPHLGFFDNVRNALTQHLWIFVPYA